MLPDGDKCRLNTRRPSGRLFFCLIMSIEQLMAFPETCSTLICQIPVNTTRPWGAGAMTQKTFEFTKEILMVLSVVDSVALVVLLEVSAKS